jgi:hypothetical protein
MPETPPLHQSGIVHAHTAEGFPLPVIDVTHPAFALEAGPDAVAELRLRCTDEERRRAHLPRFLMRWLLRRLGRQSRFAAALFAPGSKVLPGEVTYAMKLGAANLVPPFNSPTDRLLAASPQATSMRFRLQQLVQLMAAGLAAELAPGSDAPLHLLNIGGGTAIDSLNTLIVLQQHSPARLQRPISIRVLDPDAASAQFAQQALAALLQGSLKGLTVQMMHVAYDWLNPAPLAALLQQLSERGALSAASSEGALFEYADDEVVIENLKALRAGAGVRLLGGTVTRADALARAALRHNRFDLHPRGADGLAPLAHQAGFTIAAVATALLSDQVLLRPL